MFSIFYNIAIFFLLLLYLPKGLFDFIFHRKYRENFFSRIKKNIPQRELSHPIIWIHAVSVGETKAAIPLAKAIKKELPHCTFFFTTVTETGMKEAKRSLPFADAFSFLPFDFSFLMRTFVSSLKPDLFLIVDGDFWYQAIHFVKKHGGRVMLVNGKLSERSKKRYQTFSSFAKAMFRNIDFFFVQSQTYLNRFKEIGVPLEKMKVVGNLKFDIPSPERSIEEIKAFKADLGISSQDLLLTCGSTHEGEEKLLLEVLSPLWSLYPSLKILLVPRHPERFSKIKHLLKEKNLFFFSFSEKEKRKGGERVILVDKMGILPLCYQISDLAVVGGSFVKGIGGHDIFEPAKMGTPTLFGPYMEAQEELKNLLLQGEAGFQVEARFLYGVTKNLLEDSKAREKMKENGKELARRVKGSSITTWKEISQKIFNL